MTLITPTDRKRQSRQFPRPMSIANPKAHDLERPSRPKQERRRRRSRIEKDAGDEKTHATLKEILRTVWPSLTWKDRCIMILGFSCSIIHAGATPVFSYVFAQLLATLYASREERARQATKWSLSVLGVAIVDSAATYLMHFLLEYCGQNWVDGIRIEAMKRILDQPRQFFDEERNSVSRLIENLDRNAEDMRNLVGRFAAFILIASVMMLVAVIWALAISWKLTLVALASAPAMYAATAGFETVAGRLERKWNDAIEVANAIFTETFTNIRTVRALTLEKHFHEKYSVSTADVFRAGIRRAAYAGVFFGAAEAMIMFVNALVFYYGSVLVANKEYSVNNILEVFSMLLFSFASVNSIMAFIPQMSASRDTGTRLLRLATLPLGSHELQGTVRIQNAGNIAITKLNFAYPSRPSQPVLRNLSLHIPQGTCVALTGSSGSGKSTIASLLLNLYSTGHTGHVSTPEISIAGRDLKRVHTPSLRSLITIVQQTPTLFPASVRENIAYGLPRESPLKSIHHVRDAAIAAGIDDFIATLPDGFETAIGEGGTGLSGGQAQRIAIARALVRRPHVLVLDEATSALDAESARVVQDSLVRLLSSPATMLRLPTTPLPSLVQAPAA